MIDTQNEMDMVLTIHAPYEVRWNSRLKFFRVGGRWNQKGTMSIR